MGFWDVAAIDIGNVALAGVGLAFVFWQVRQARGAAEAAHKAATEAREVMTQRVTAADLGSVRANLRALLPQLRAEQYESAWLLCQDAREQLVALRSRRGLDARQDRLTGAIMTLAETQNILEGDEPQSALANMERIRATLDMLVEFREDALYSAGEGNAHEQRSG